MRLVLLVTCVALLGCRVDTGWDSEATYVTPGVYEGELIFEVKAMFGPLRVGYEDCVSNLVLDVDPDQQPTVLGTAGCDFGSYGEASLELTGELVGLPDVDGSLTSEVLSGDWIGVFLDNETLVGEFEGTVPWRGGVRLVYEGTFEVVRTGRLVEDDDVPSTPGGILR